MAKWADYCISAVRYDEDETHIDKVKVHEDKEDSIGSASEWTRSSVASKIDSGNTFVTITKNSDDKWNKGEDVHIIKVNEKKYIRTDANKKESDNLGDLPTF
ncbi:DUF3892 domain-containing protein [candidate division KSB1 bacterium]|nr:DUF3892 domain-containing protein [candidate division KSB1 bacterium]